MCEQTWVEITAVRQEVVVAVVSDRLWDVSSVDFTDVSVDEEDGETCILDVEVISPVVVNGHQVVKTVTILSIVCVL